MARFDFRSHCPIRPIKQEFLTFYTFLVSRFVFTKKKYSIFKNENKCSFKYSRNKIMTLFKRFLSKLINLNVELFTQFKDFGINCLQRCQYKLNF